MIRRCFGVTVPARIAGFVPAALLALAACGGSPAGASSTAPSTAPAASAKPAGASANAGAGTSSGASASSANGAAASASAAKPAAGSSAAGSSGAAAKPAGGASASTGATSSAAKPASAASASPAGGTSAAAKPGATKVSVAYGNVSGNQISLFVAGEGGYFSNNGLNVDLQLASGASKTMAVVVGNQVDIGYVGGSPLISANAEGADLMSVASVVGVYPFNFEAAPNIKTMDDIKGKSIGISNVGAGVDLATRRLLQQYNIDVKDVNLVPDSGDEIRIAGLLGGATQAAMASPPGSLAVEAKGFHPLVNLAQQKLPSAETGIIASRAWIQGHHDVMQEFVDSIVQATARAKKDRPYTISVMKKYFKSDDDAVMNATYDFFVQDVYASLPTVTPEQFATVLDQLSKTNDKLKGYDVSKAIDSSFVKSAGDRGLDKQ
jgi:NitT/TauT family transport system substrate-binding protein